MSAPRRVHCAAGAVVAAPIMALLMGEGRAR
jgi:hypothetical protein